MSEGKDVAMANNIDDYFRVRSCKVCKKEFVIHGEYAYKVAKPGKRPQYFCSWKCLRKNESVGRKKKGNPKSEYADEICRMLGMGYEIAEICEKLNVTAGTVKYWKLFGEIPITDEDLRRTGMSTDEVFQEVFKRMDKVRWRGFENDERYEWYYAEEGIYAIRRKASGEVMYLKAFAPMLVIFLESLIV